MNIEWSEKYELGIDKIDTQHKRLVSIINRLEEAWRENKHSDTVKTIFQSLRDYTNYHFSFEEMAMERNRFHNVEDIGDLPSLCIIPFQKTTVKWIAGKTFSIRSW